MPIYHVRVHYKNRNKSIKGTKVAWFGNIKANTPHGAVGYARAYLATGNRSVGEILSIEVKEKKNA